jgi:putative nucleotidyltransferase with HDIG domain
MGQAETDEVASPIRVRLRRSPVEWVGVYVTLLAVLAFSGLGVVAYSQAYWGTLHPAGEFPWVSFLILLGSALFAESYTVRAGSGAEVSAGFLVCFLSFAVLGPLGGTLVAVGSQLLSLRDRQWERTLCYVATIGFVTSTASLLYWFALSRIGGFAESPAAVVAAVGLGVGVLYHFVNFVLVVPILRLRRGIGMGQAWTLTLKPFLPFALFFLAISVGLISVYRAYLPADGGGANVYSTILVVLCLLPVVGLIYAFQAYAHQRTLAKTNARLALRNERLALQAVASQITALDLKDDYTARHSAAVARWALDIAEALELSEHQKNVTHLASLLHDIGKIGIPDDVLKSPARLDRVNWNLIEGHCYNGYKILKNMDQFEEVAEVVLHHHERFDGTGYPNGLSGGNIPLISRIICVADSYSAMVSDRPYGPALPPEIGMAELEIKKGTQFDPVVVDCFLAMLDVYDESYRKGQDADFHVEVQAVKFLRELPPDLDDEEEPVVSQPTSRPALAAVGPRVTADPNARAVRDKARDEEYHRRTRNRSE